MTSRNQVYEALDSERAYQAAKALRAGKGGEAVHSPEEFIVYMEDYLREAKTQLSRSWTPDGQVPEAMDTMRKVVALGVACMEQNGCRTREADEDAKTEAMRP